MTACLLFLNLWFMYSSFFVFLVPHFQISIPFQISSNISFFFLSLVHISSLTYYPNGYKTWQKMKY
ncbi:hypothetical protein C1646_714595 [Rhizophagus diaphanus]|nr:hypothetical protein C1646_714595 [Rhizophagus diaphanus] [Rhizophagus sp. MUCL 43196]